MEFSQEAKNYIQGFEDDLKQNNFNNIFGDYFKHLKKLSSKETAQEVIDIFINAKVNFFNYLVKVIHFEFQEMVLPSKIIGPNIETIGDCAFIGTNIESIYFPNCEYIGDMAFSTCTGLKTINLDNAETIGHHAFYHCSITKLSLLNAVRIDSNAFGKCFNLEELYIPSYSTFEPLETSILNLFTIKDDYPKLKAIYVSMSKDKMVPITLEPNTVGYKRIKNHFPNLKVIDYNTKEVIRDYTK